MVNSISSVRFGEAPDMFSRPGAYTKPEENFAMDAPVVKKSKTKKAIFGTLAAAVIVLGSAVALRKFCPDTFKILESTEGVKLLDKVKHYVAKTGQYIIDKSCAMGKWMKNLFSAKSI